MILTKRKLALSSEEFRATEDVVYASFEMNLAVGEFIGIGQNLEKKCWEVIIYQKKEARA